MQLQIILIKMHHIRIDKTTLAIDVDRRCTDLSRRMYVRVGPCGGKAGAAPARSGSDAESDCHLVKLSRLRLIAE